MMFKVPFRCTVLTESCQPDNIKDGLLENNLVSHSETTENFLMIKVLNVGLRTAFFL